MAQCWPPQRRSKNSKATPTCNLLRPGARTPRRAAQGPKSNVPIGSQLWEHRHREPGADAGRWGEGRGQRGRKERKGRRDRDRLRMETEGGAQRGACGEAEEQQQAALWAHAAGEEGIP